MARPPHWQNILDASTQEACLAVRLYNDPFEPRSFESFVIHMHLAWLYLLHAQFERNKIDYRYWDPNKKNRLKKVDGEPKRWELERSVQERWKNKNSPVKANIQMFIRLRNRLEHRHAQVDEALMLYLSGHAHSLLINYEEELTDKFGKDRTLATHLRLPLFIGTFTEEGERSLKKFKENLPKDIQKFLTTYEAGLDTSITSSSQYELRLRATLELAPKDPDALAIQFTHYDDLDENQKKAIEQLGRRGQVITREKKQNVSGHGRLLPAAAAKKIEARIPFKFGTTHFAGAWKIKQWRPRKDSSNPYRTNTDFCEYDEPTNSYRYKESCVRTLVKECSTEEGFKRATGFKPKSKPTLPKD